MISPERKLRLCLPSRSCQGQSLLASAAHSRPRPALTLGQAEAIETARENAQYLPGAALPPAVEATSSLEATRAADVPERGEGFPSARVGTCEQWPNIDRACFGNLFPQVFIGRLLTC